MVTPILERTIEKFKTRLSVNELAENTFYEQGIAESRSNTDGDC
jgi:hypothetical protein